MRDKFFKPSDMKSMPWKNGGGRTLEVVISPAGAQVGALDFDWRVSIAQVDADGPFSLFPGYDRQLVVWKGSGLSVNGVEHKALLPFEFAGETAIDAKLIEGPVQDFGVIFKRGRIKSTMTTHKLQENATLEIDVNQADLFVLCARGELRIGEFYLNPGDVVHVQKAPVKIKALDRSELITVFLSPVI